MTYISEDEFKKHLDKCSKEVSLWPKWKREASYLYRTVRAKK